MAQTRDYLGLYEKLSGLSGKEGVDYPGVVKGEPAGPGDFEIYFFNIYSKNSFVRL